MRNRFQNNDKEGNYMGMKRISKELKTFWSWVTEDGINLGQPIACRGNEMIFNHPNKGGGLVAQYGILDEEGKFHKCCKSTHCIGCDRKPGEGFVCRKNVEEKAEYYVNL